mgnify:CR=1 FL=1
MTTKKHQGFKAEQKKIAKSEGAVCRMGGGPASRPECGSGWFVEPTIFTGVKPGMRIANEEVFGPVLSIIPFEDEDEAVEIANNTIYGLAAAPPANSPLSTELKNSWGVTHIFADVAHAAGNKGTGVKVAVLDTLGVSIGASGLADEAQPLADHVRANEGRELAIAVHPLDRHRLERPRPMAAPFPIPAVVPTRDLQEGDRITAGEINLRVMHTPGHTEGSISLHDAGAGILYSGDTLFQGAWGRTDLPGGDETAMISSLARLATLDPSTRVIPGHGNATRIGDESAWIDGVVTRGVLRMEPR